MMWSKKYNLNCCKNCGMNKVLHKARGLCNKCYRKKEYEENKSVELMQMKKYQRLHKVQIKKYSKQYRKLYEDERSKSWKIWYERNKTDRLTYLKEYRKSHKNEKRIRDRKYYKLNTQKVLNRNRKRNATKQSVDFWTKEMSIHWEWMLDATEGYCPKCGEPFDNGIHKCTMDHVIPLTPRLGNPQGIHHIDNVQVLCGSCNSKKHNKEFLPYDI